jgi:hypothetical protein
MDYLIIRDYALNLAFSGLFARLARHREPALRRWYLVLDDSL